MKLYTLEFNCNTPTTQQVNIPTNTDYMVGIKVTKNGEVLDIKPTEMTLGGTEADATKMNGYVTFTSASGDTAKYESNTVAIEMEDGFETTFTLNINVYKSQQGYIATGGSGSGVTEQWVQEYVSAETSAFVTDTELGTVLEAYPTTSDMTSAIESATSTFVSASAVEAAISTATSSFVTSSAMESAISTATSTFVSASAVEAAISASLVGYATTSYVDSQIGTVLSQSF